MSVRPPAVAGLFYPGRTEVLRQRVEALLAAADAAAGRSSAVDPKVLVVPHAGYVYSGALAAQAYRLLAGRRSSVRRVVLLGPAHRFWVSGLALPGCETFRTPLGDAAIDAELAAAVRALPGVNISDAAHAEEHSLEVQLPFLQAVLEDFTLLPLLVGGATAAEVAAVLEEVWGGDETLIVVSTDLSHFHDLATARRIDAGTAAAIESFDADLRSEQACGAGPLNGLLLLADRKSLGIGRIGLATSAEASGSEGRVVGYGAWWLAESPLASAP